MFDIMVILDLVHDLKSDILKYQDMDKLASLNRSWQSKDGTFRALGNDGNWTNVAQVRAWLDHAFALANYAKGVVPPYQYVL